MLEGHPASVSKPSSSCYAVLSSPGIVCIIEKNVQQGKYINSLKKIQDRPQIVTGVMFLLENLETFQEKMAEIETKNSK